MEETIYLQEVKVIIFNNREEVNHSFLIIKIINNYNKIIIICLIKPINNKVIKITVCLINYRIIKTNNNSNLNNKILIIHLIKIKIIAINRINSKSIIYFSNNNQISKIQIILIYFLTDVFNKTIIMILNIKIINYKIRILNREILI